MLYSVDKLKYVSYIPHEDDYLRWKKGLTDQEFQQICIELNNRIVDNEVHTSSWMPGHDWSNTVFFPIYTACAYNQEFAAKFFGIILWIVLLNRDDVWGFGRYEKNNIPIKGMTYFLLQDPPKKS